MPGHGGLRSVRHPLVLGAALWMLAGCETTPTFDEVCLSASADRCVGPAYSDLTRRDLRRRQGVLALRCNGVDQITDSYRQSCFAQLRDAHAALQSTWADLVDFAPPQDSDIAPVHPCVDFVDKSSGQLNGGWCWSQFEAHLTYRWVTAKPSVHRHGGVGP